MATRSGIAASTKHPQTVRYPSQRQQLLCGLIRLPRTVCPACSLPMWRCSSRRGGVVLAEEGLMMASFRSRQRLRRHSNRNGGCWRDYYSRDMDRLSTRTSQHEKLRKFELSFTRPATLSCAPPKRWHLHHEWDLHRRTLSHGRCALQLSPLAWRAPPLALLTC